MQLRMWVVLLAVAAVSCKVEIPADQEFAEFRDVAADVDVAVGADADAEVDAGVDDADATLVDAAAEVDAETEVDGAVDAAEVDVGTDAAEVDVGKDVAEVEVAQPCSPTDCDDSNDCTVETCDETKGCVSVPGDASCTDGDACTVGDACKGGACLPGAATACDDGNPCTDDSCDKTQGCVYAANLLSCSDGDACTVGDACKGGACLPGAATACDDGNPCTDDSCDKTLGCVYSANSLSCSDGDACTVGDACKGGACLPGAATACDDGNPCTDDSCDKALGCVYAANSLNCSDGDACTDGDTCSAKACAPGKAKVCDDGNPCTDDSCDKSQGCVYSANSLSCSDGDACTDGDACSAKACAPGKAKVCDDGQVCTTDSCDKTQGCVYTANSLSCSDGDACTDGDACSAKACAPGKAKVCDDGQLCTTDSCDKTQGCVYGANSLSCSDGDACTVGDGCKGGACLPGAVTKCDDGNTCTSDSCDALKGCYVKQLDAVGCSDGSVCTENDGCKAGACVPGKPLSCSDGNPCTSDTCAATIGCQNQANTSSCDDGKNCTIMDLCAGGSCAGKPKLFYSKIQATTLKAMAGAAESSLILVGTVDGGGGVADATIVRMDLSGAVLWNKKVGGAFSDDLKFVATAPSGWNVVVAGSTNSKGAGASDAWLFTLDQSGEVIWQGTYGGTGNDSVRALSADKDGFAAVVNVEGKGLQAKRWTWSGAEVWTKSVGGFTEVHSMIADDDGGLLIAGDSDGACVVGKPVASAAKFTAKGELLWFNKFEISGACFWAQGMAISRLSADRIALAGFGAKSGWVFPISEWSEIHVLDNDGSQIHVETICSAELPTVNNQCPDRESAVFASSRTLPTGALFVGLSQYPGYPESKKGVLLDWRNASGSSVHRVETSLKGPTMLSDTVSAYAVVALPDGGAAVLVRPFDYAFWDPKPGADFSAVLRVDPWGHSSCSAAGGCAELTPKTCDDGNACTFDICSPTAGCVHNVAPNGAPCDDGNDCTVETCSAGKCSFAAKHAGYVAMSVNGSPFCAPDYPVWGNRPLSPAAALKDNFDGTVSDSGTGLQWKKENSPSEMQWSGAATYCDELELAGASDWRMPTSAELLSLADYTAVGGIAPPFVAGATGGVWSATRSAQDPDAAWYWVHGDAAVGIGALNSKFHVRCVRGAPKSGLGSIPPPDRFKLIGKTAFDSATSLTWYTQIVSDIAWSGASGACSNLAAEGGGWRLPNVVEMNSIIDRQHWNPAVDPVAFSGFYKAWSWTSTPVAGKAGAKWSVNTYLGQMTSSNNTSNSSAVACVR